MRIEYNKDTPHFSSEELREIYRNTEEKTSKALRQTAHRLYPGRDSVTYENLFIREGYARAYMHKGEYSAAATVWSGTLTALLRMTSMQSVAEQI